MKLPVPKDLYCTIISPQVTVRTYDARQVLTSRVSFKDAITQCGNLGGFITSLFTENYDLMSRSLVDVLVEPQRALLIPKFYDLKKEGLAAGAIGVGISGSGPSVFALCRGKESAEQVAEAFEKVYENTEIEHKLYVSPINMEGCRII